MDRRAFYNERLKRGYVLRDDVSVLGKGEYRVESIGERAVAYYIDMNAVGGPSCDCEDQYYRARYGVPCKHVLAVLIFQRHPVIMKDLAEIGL